ncbi:ADP-ribosylation factor-like protein 14 [Pristis pectinata]|uniref:ADP-ribosylation factor-like protein 14 n=1 Tax=Pristis pectinata TaxID=685728 RepID=UPI00223E12AC|nr:ADP-ribosylation factor-like protein 14 [Pristis pectinata]
MGLLTSKELKTRHVRILMLGLEEAGKSTLLYKLKFSNTEFLTASTIGFNVEMLQHDKSVALTVWDVGGQYKMRQLWPFYFQDTDGLMFVVDSADKERMEDSRKEFERTLKHECLKGIPVVVMANKQDLKGALSAEEITKRFHLKRCCSDRDWYVQPCCAKTGEGLSAAFNVLISHVKRKMPSKDEGPHIYIQEDR